MAEKNGGVHRLKLGIIGCGLAVRYLHWPALSKLQDKYEIVMLCDIDAKAAQGIGQLVGKEDLPYTADYRELLAEPNVEAVLSSLPIELSAPIMLEAIRAGKPIIGEKPIAGDWPTALEVVQAAEASSVVVEIAENFHYRRDFRQARAWIDNGRLGQVFLIEMQGHMYIDPTVSFAQTPWRQKSHVKYQGGVIADAAVHHAAGLRELGGDVAQIQAYTKSMHPIMAAPDTITANVQFKNGVIGNLRYSGATHVKESFHTAMIYGERGTIFLDDGVVRLQLLGQPDETVKIPDFDNGYYAEFANFWEAVVNGTPVVSTPREALRDWEIIMKAMASAESGQAIRFE